MSETIVEIGKGSHLAFGDGASPELYTNFAEMLDINRTQSGDTPEATHADSPNHANGVPSKEYIVGVIEPGEYTFQENLIPDDATQDDATGAEAILLIKKNFALRDIPNASKDFVFPGAITNIGDSFPQQGLMVRDLTVKVMGPGAWVTPVTSA